MTTTFRIESGDKAEIVVRGTPSEISAIMDLISNKEFLGSFLQTGCTDLTMEKLS